LVELKILCKQANSVAQLKMPCPEENCGIQLRFIYSAAVV